MVIPLVLLLLGFACWTTPAMAQTGTSVGTLTLSATFDTIWVKASFSGDTNVNNSFTLQYKPTSSGTWLSAYNPPADRRSSVHGGVSNAANQNQFRAGIFGLTAGGTYDVRVTYSDPDGVAGGPSLSGAVKLLSSATVVQNGGTFYLDDIGTNGNGSSASPFNSFANAFAQTNCGDKLIVRSGSYAAFNFSKNCSSSAWYEIEAETPLGPSIRDAQGRVILVSGSYVKISGLKIPTATCSAVEFASGSNNVWLEGLKIDDVGTTVVSIGHASAYGCNGIRINSNNHHLYLLNNTITGATLTAIGPGSPQWETCCNGIGMEGTPAPAGAFVLKGNKITGGFRDSIGNSGEVPPFGMDYSDVINNVITNQVDDGIQIEGTDVNLLIQGNVVTSDKSFSCYAAQTGYFGPIYWIRNTCRMTSGTTSGSGFKIGGLQNAFMFHNSVETTNGSHDCMGDALGATDTKNIIAYNNVFKCQANPLYKIYSTGTKFNNNLYYRANGTYIASAWNGSANYDLGGLRGVGQELNGKFSNPLFVDSALHIGSTGPAIDAGALIANINSVGSKWPFAGSAPDLGAFEAGGTGSADTVPPAAPVNLRVQ